jgi:hypothetical protein
VSQLVRPVCLRPCLLGIAVLASWMSRWGCCKVFWGSSRFEVNVFYGEERRLRRECG